MDRIDQFLADVEAMHTRGMYRGALRLYGVRDSFETSAMSGVEAIGQFLVFASRANCDDSMTFLRLHDGEDVTDVITGSVARLLTNIIRKNSQAKEQFNERQQSV